MYYYLKGKNRIGPVGAGRIIELSDAGAIDDSTLVWNKAERWPKWRRLGDCRAEISESRKVCRHSGHLRGLARSTMFFRAFLISAIAGASRFSTPRAITACCWSISAVREPRRTTSSKSP